MLEFDKRLRALLLYAIERIEVKFRTAVSYYHTHKYGAAGYTDVRYFVNSNHHAGFLSELDKYKMKNCRKLFIAHHINKYAGILPLWAAVEIMTAAMLSKLFSNMHDVDKRALDVQFYRVGFRQLVSWIQSISYLRNECAHFNRLYFSKMACSTKPPKDSGYIESNRVFDIILVMQYLYPDQKLWTSEVVRPLECLVNEYGDYIDLEYVGFPNDWVAVLLNAARVK